MEKRRRIWVDPFQTKLLIRMGLYCVCYQVSLTVIIVAWTVFCQFFANGIRPLQLADFLPALVGLLVVLPMLVWDVIKFSHRLVGPLVRFRKAMRAIADGEPIGPIKLRDGDFMTELRDDFNRMLEALQARGHLPEPQAHNEKAVAV